MPGAGAIMSVYNLAKWVIDNQTQLRGLFDKFLDAIDALANTDEAAATAAVKQNVRQGLNDVATVLISALAGQVGLGSLPQKLQQAAQFVPNKVDAALKAAVAKVAGAVLAAISGGSAGLPPKIIARQEFTYP
ncbi:MAG: hypothetical protein K2V38_24855, partial [Gemmataceae bacterium]|nr:hypothetical protein [Gemmataceae bacterium]